MFLSTLLIHYAAKSVPRRVNSAMFFSLLYILIYIIFHKKYFVREKIPLLRFSGARDLFWNNFRGTDTLPFLTLSCVYDRTVSRINSQFPRKVFFFSLIHVIYSNLTTMMNIAKKSRQLAK